MGESKGKYSDCKLTDFSGFGGKGQKIKEEEDRQPCTEKYLLGGANSVAKIQKGRSETRNSGGHAESTPSFWEAPHNDCPRVRPRVGRKEREQLSRAPSLSRGDRNTSPTYLQGGVGRARTPFRKRTPQKRNAPEVHIPPSSFLIDLFSPQPH